MSWFARLNPFASAKPQQGVSSDTLDKVLDSVGSGDFTFDFFDDMPVGQNIRNAALGFAAYYRCVTLLSSMMAQLLTGSSLRIIDREGNIVDTPRARRILDFFEESPDGRCPAHEFFEDACAEYLIEGNALLEIKRGLQGRVVGLDRLSSWDANTVAARNGMMVYEARRIGSDSRVLHIAETDVIHVRWPRVLRHSASSSANRWNFAPPPVRLLRQSLEIGLASNRYVRDFYRLGNKSTVGISPEEDIIAEEIPAVIKLIDRAAKNRQPLLMPKKASFTNLAQRASDSDQSALLEFVVTETARVYGIPGPIIGQNVTQWGQGIESLSRMLWKYGLKQHLNRFLAPARMALLLPGQKFELDPIDVLRGDIQPLAQFIQAVKGDAQSEQIFTREELRRMGGAPVTPEYGTLRDLETEVELTDEEPPNTEGVPGETSGDTEGDD